MTRLAIAGALFLCLAGCRGQTSRQTQIVPIRNMHIQPRYSYQSSGAFYEDRRVMRKPVDGTIAREMNINPVESDGRNLDGSWVQTTPEAVAQRQGGPQQLVERGRERYGIYCAPCHDLTGGGHGMVIKRAAIGAFQPPSFHDDRIRHMPDGQLFATISNGIRNMPAYYAQIPVDDRWAIVTYVRALEVNQAPQLASANPGAAAPNGAVPAPAADGATAAPAQGTP